MSKFKKLKVTMRQCAYWSACLAGFVLSPQASADTLAYPSGPIVIVVPAAAGGGSDLIAREVANKLAPFLGQPVVVRNQAGANGTIGTTAVARAKPDGYTILLGTIGTHAANACLYDLPYDADKDFVPISLLGLYNGVFVVRSDSPIKTFADLIARGKAAPGELTYGISAIGTTSHLGVELLKSKAKVDFLGIPTNGIGPATMDLLGGRTDFMLDTILNSYGNIAGDKVRPLATTLASSRSKVLPDVPTVAELGYPDINVAGWAGLFAPAGTPNAIVEKIASAVGSVYKTGELQQRLGSHGLDVTTTTPSEFAKFVKDDRNTWCEVIKTAGIKVE